MSDKKCPDCGVSVGENHYENCDVARCPKCKGQRLSCMCDDYFEDAWSGEWPGKAEARELGLWCRDLLPDGTPMVNTSGHTPSGVQFHKRCQAEDVGSHEDLNSTAVFMQSFPEWELGKQLTPTQEALLLRLKTGKQG